MNMEDVVYAARVERRHPRSMDKQIRQMTLELRMPLLGKLRRSEFSDMNMAADLRKLGLVEQARQHVDDSKRMRNVNKIMGFKLP